MDSKERKQAKGITQNGHPAGGQHTGPEAEKVLTERRLLDQQEMEEQSGQAGLTSNPQPNEQDTHLAAVKRIIEAAFGEGVSTRNSSPPTHLPGWYSG